MNVDYKEGFQYGLLTLKVLKSGDLSKESNEALERAMKKGWKFANGLPDLDKNRDIVELEKQ